MDVTKQELEADLKSDRSLILQATEKVLSKIVKSECRDMKTTKIIFDFLTNILAEGGSKIP